MKLDFSKFISEAPYYASLIIDYAVLTEKLAHPEKQTFYFRQALASKEKERQQLKTRFEGIRKCFYEDSVDHLLTERAYCQSRLDRIATLRFLGFMKQIERGHFSSKLRYINMVLTLKSRLKDLHPIDYYLTDSEAFLQLLDLEKA